MQLLVTLRAERDQVLLLVTTGLTAKFEVVDLQVLHAAAELAPQPSRSSTCRCRLR
jgi:hypothetical protein